jgi:hypothetical protein
MQTSEMSGLTLNPGFLKRAISKKVAFGNPLPLSQNISVFAQQDLADSPGFSGKTSSH